MTNSPTLLLGVDTGGTYTDAVLLRADDLAVVAGAKALTTRGDLAIGVSEAIDRIAADLDPDRVRLVSISTTLATNAVVEGHGSPVLVLLCGFDDRMVERSGILSAFSDVVVERVRGGHDHHGAELAPLDVDGVTEVLERHAGRVRAVAVASAFAVRNPSHEDQIRSTITATTDLPVTVSSELSESLDAPRRALTAALNARLLSRISDLVIAVRTSLDRVGIDAPLTIAKGDGSLAVADAVAQRPIETILSGPAASMVGAATLTGVDDFILSDMGGTTTDVGLSVGGRPQLAPEGAMVGGWRTMVRAIDVRTTGLGGDSEVTTARADVMVGPRRLVPVSLLGADSEAVVSHLRRAIDDPPSRELAARFVVRPTGAKPPTEALSAIEARVLGRVPQEGPAPLEAVAEGSVERRSLDALAERGYVQLGGFTPSDAAHVLGFQDNWSAAAAETAAELMAWYTGLGVEDFCRAVWSETVRRSAGAVLDVAFEGRGPTDPSDPVIDAATNGAGMLGSVRVHLQPTVPVVAVGGPARVYYEEVARRLEADLRLPDRFEIANAVGAAAGVVVASGSAEVHADGPGLLRLVSVRGVETASDATACLVRARELATSIARENLVAQSVGLPDVSEPEIDVTWTRHDHPDAVGDEGLYFAEVTAVATARP